MFCAGICNGLNDTFSSLSLTVIVNALVLIVDELGWRLHSVTVSVDGLFVP